MIRPLNTDGSYMYEDETVSAVQVENKDSNENTVTITREENVVCEAVEGEDDFVVTKNSVSTVVKNDEQVVLNGNWYTNLFSI